MVRGFNLIGGFRLAVLILPYLSGMTLRLKQMLTECLFYKPSTNMSEEPKITFTNLDSSKNSKPAIRLPVDYSDLLKKFEFQTNIVIGIFVVAFITLVCMVGGILIDSFHFNSVVYKEYSEKTTMFDQLETTNASLQTQIQQNQELILNQQKQILNSFGEQPLKIN